MKKILLAVVIAVAMLGGSVAAISTLTDTPAYACDGSDCRQEGPVTKFTVR